MSDTLPLRHGAAPGQRMPVLGFGVYQIPPGETTRRAVLAALAAGYRHIDTAQLYRNEADVAAALRESGVPRDEVFITTKLANPNQGYDSAKRTLERSLQEMRLQFVDLFLIHFPVTGRRQDSWRALSELRKEGKTKAIGVSNYTVRHLSELLQTSDVRPAVNQVELSPFCAQPELVRSCQAEGIVVQAYSPLTQGRKLAHKEVVRIAEAHGRSSAQVLLRWGVQHGLVVLPKSVTQSRIEANARIFDFTLTAADMAALDALDENFRTCWDPTDVP